MKNNCGDCRCDLSVAKKAYYEGCVICSECHESKLNVDKITIRELKKLAEDQRLEGLTIKGWKLLVKGFAVKHKLYDRDAVAVARMARDRF